MTATEHSYSVATVNKYTFLSEGGDDSGDIEFSMSAMNLQKEKKDSKKKGKKPEKKGKSAYVML